MNRISAMPLPPCNAKCAIHCATAIGFSKVNCFFDFISAEPFGSAFFLPIKFPEWYTEPVEVLAEGNVIRV
ncbi:MAG: hypothetical protein IK114_00410 [Fibrobacter sp.]|nr:hypothetical protein [Fibrobacter sp.]